MLTFPPRWFGHFVERAGGGRQCYGAAQRSAGLQTSFVSFDGACVPMRLSREADTQVAQQGAPERLRLVARHAVQQRQIARWVARAPARPLR